MIKGRKNKLVGQTGEYLVAAELARRGLIATTFTGNVPHYDIVASDETGRHVSVQVKTSNGNSWQFANITQYCEITFFGDRQAIGEPKSCPVNRLIVVFVSLDATGNDRFFILTWEDLRDTLVEAHQTFLDKHGGIRPKQPKSLHCAISDEHLVAHRDKWEIVEKYLM